MRSVLLDQTGNRRGKLGAVLLPVSQTVNRDAQGFGITGGNRIVKADTLNETTIATITGIGNNHVVEGALLGTTTGKTDNNHRYSFVSRKKDPELYRFFRETQSADRHRGAIAHPVYRAKHPIDPGFCYSAHAMKEISEKNAPTTAGANIKNILEWLALAHGRVGSDDAEPLLRQLQLLRETAVANNQRTKVLDLLYTQVQRVVQTELSRLNEISLPVSRKLRLRVRTILELLETLAQDYFNTLAELFDPQSSEHMLAPEASLRRAMHAIAWQIRIYNLIASPTRLGLWQQFHAGFSSARRLGLDAKAGPSGSPTVQRIYTDTLLAAIAQPASFSSAELEFISDYIENCTPALELFDTPPLDSDSVFWTDPEKDFPAQAMIRRSPSADGRAQYFSCTAIAAACEQHRLEIDKGTSTSALGLPDFAASHAGKSVLARLARLWGKPSKRKFPRRHQSYRTHLCAGLHDLWTLLRSANEQATLSEWMVTNESPDGYALMHMSGHTEDLRPGDIVALKASSGDSRQPLAWNICIIRWAISENPEHVEVGLELLASKAMAVEVAQPSQREAGKMAALILPGMPPLRPNESLVLPSGIVTADSRRLLVLIEGENLEIREMRIAHIDEQTSAIEVFSVLPDPTA